LTVVGASIGLAVTRERVTPEIRVLSVGSAAALASLDTYYVAKRRISPVYLLDAAINASLAIAVAWRSD
jgi:hypothetical protein